MDLDNIQQNMNTRVVFKEPRGMIRWLQLFFAIIALSSITNFHTTIGIDITCPQQPSSITSSTTTTSTSTTSTTSTTTPAPASSNAPVPASSSTTSTTSTTTKAPATPSAAPAQVPAIKHLKLEVTYPFDFSKQSIVNNCPGYNFSYMHQTSLESSPQFFVFTSSVSLVFAALTLIFYLIGSTTYHSIPIIPVADLIVTGLLCLFWFLGSSAFGSGASMVKNSVTYGNLKQTLCPGTFEEQVGALCVPGDEASWKSINIGLISGFTSFFLWGAGMWFVYKETHFHTPRDQFGPPRPGIYP